MIESHSPDDTQDIEEADRHKEIGSLLHRLNDELQNTDKIGNTKLSELFHVARTSSPRNRHSRVDAGIDYADGELNIKILGQLEGGHYRPPDVVNSYDAMLSCAVKPFMTADEFKKRMKNPIKSEAQKHIDKQKSK